MTAKASRSRSLSARPSSDYRPSNAEWFTAKRTALFSSIRDLEEADGNSTLAFATKAAGVPSLDDLRRLSEEIRQSPYWINE